MPPILKVRLLFSYAKHFYLLLAFYAKRAMFSPIIFSVLLQFIDYLFPQKLKNYSISFGNLYEQMNSMTSNIPQQLNKICCMKESGTGAKVRMK